MPTSTGTSGPATGSARRARSRAPISSRSRECGVPWIDLHWLFQVAISWVYEHGGVVALNLAKCVVTCVAVLLLVTARRRDWPVWVMLLAWLPALLVLGGRMYVRPETLTLLYLSIFLAVVTRWDRYPSLAAALAVVQVAWVNSQGLFVLGPIILVFALIDAALRRGAFAPERRRWWRIVGSPAWRRSRPVWSIRTASPAPLSDRARRDHEQPGLLPEHRGADADPRVHPSRPGCGTCRCSSTW